MTDREEELSGMLVEERQTVRDAVLGLSRCVSEITALKAENQRLRAALETILARALPCGLDSGDSEIVRLAQQALEVSK